MKSAPEAESEGESEREQEKWQGRDVGVVFCFFATGYIYNYLAGIEWPEGFFNKGRRHIQSRALPTDQHRTRETEKGRKVCPLISGLVRTPISHHLHGADDLKRR